MKMTPVGAPVTFDIYWTPTELRCTPYLGSAYTPPRSRHVLLLVKTQGLCAIGHFFLIIVFPNE
jgi:hypothetical protein